MTAYQLYWVCFIFCRIRVSAVGDISSLGSRIEGLVHFSYHLCSILLLKKILHNPCLICAGWGEGEKHLHKENRQNDKNTQKSDEITLFLAKIRNFLCIDFLSSRTSIQTEAPLYRYYQKSWFLHKTSLSAVFSAPLSVCKFICRPERVYMHHIRTRKYGGELMRGHWAGVFYFLCL